MKAEEEVQLREEVSRLRAENQQLREQLAQALALIAKLQAELEHLRANPPPSIKPNTSKPTDKDKTKADKKARRKRAKEQNGARRREQIPTRTVEHRLEKCPDCGYGLRHPRLAGRRQLIELPPPAPVEVTEHQLFKSWCARCGKWHYACVDLSGQVVGRGRMGVGIASLVAYLRTSLRLPVRQITEYLYTVHGLTISSGEIVELLHRVAQAEPIKIAVHSIKARVRASSIVHGDETSWRQEGQNGYVWCFCTPQGERYYEYDRSRGGAVVKRILGTEFKGTLVTDFYAAYNDLPCEHQRCWVHLLRDLHELKEAHLSNEEVVAWIGQVRKLYDTAKLLLQGHGLSPPGELTEQQREVLYIESVQQARELGLRYAGAKEHKEHPCHTLSKRLLLYIDELFQFVLTPGLSADNNLAERSVRPVVVMRKVSGGSQSGKGSQTRMMLTSLFSTWRAKGLNPFFQCLTLLSQPALYP
jgi:transposase